MAPPRQLKTTAEPPAIQEDGFRGNSTQKGDPKTSASTTYTILRSILICFAGFTIYMGMCVINYGVVFTVYLAVAAFLAALGSFSLFVMVSLYPHM